MVGPARKREAVKHVAEGLKTSERRACAGLVQPRSTQRYQGRRPSADAGLIKAMRRIARRETRAGYRSVARHLRREGWQVNIKRIHRLWKQEGLKEPARKKAAALYKKHKTEFKEKEIHQKVEVGKLDILDTRKMKDGAGVSCEAVDIEAEGNLVRTGTLHQIEFREVAKFKITFFFVRNPDLMGNGRLSLVVQDFKYEEKPL